MSYLKKLNTQEEYDAFKESSEFVTPNVSLIVDGKIVMYNKKKVIPNNEIRYTSNTNTVVQPYNNNFGGSNVISNTYENGVGIITFDTDVTAIGNYAFDGCSSLTSITIPNSVTSIGGSAFKDCSSLTSITIPNSVTSIGSFAFSYCSSLTSITIPDSVTSIGGRAFSGCTELTSIIVDKNNPIYDSRDNCNAIIETESNVLMHGCKIRSFLIQLLVPVNMHFIIVLDSPLLQYLIRLLKLVHMHLRVPDSPLLQFHIQLL